MYCHQLCRDNPDRNDSCVNFIPAPSAGQLYPQMCSGAFVCMNHFDYADKDECQAVQPTMKPLPVSFQPTPVCDVNKNADGL